MNFSRASFSAMVLLAGGLLVTGCIRTDNRIEVAPIEVKPIHITADINLNVKIDRSLDEFFSYQAPAPTTAPAVVVPTPTTIPAR